MKDTFFSYPRFLNLCRKEVLESWRSNVLRIILLYGLMTIAMLWMAYFEYSRDVYSEIDPMWDTLLAIFVCFLFGGGCLSASLVMERMKTKTSRISMLMTPATSFEKFSVRWFIFTIVFLLIFLITYKMADYTRVLVYSLAYPNTHTITPLDFSYLMGDRDYGLSHHGWLLGFIVAVYFFFQSLFVLGSSIWPKNSFLKTFAAGSLIFLVYISVATLLGKALFEVGGNYNLFEREWTREQVFCLLIMGCALFTLVNWTIAYFRFKEAEILNRM